MLSGRKGVNTKTQRDCEQRTPVMPDNTLYLRGQAFHGVPFVFPGNTRSEKTWPLQSSVGDKYSVHVKWVIRHRAGPGAQVFRGREFSLAVTLYPFWGEIVHLAKSLGVNGLRTSERGGWRDGFQGIQCTYRPRFPPSRLDQVGEHRTRGIRSCRVIPELGCHRHVKTS